MNEDLVNHLQNPNFNSNNSNNENNPFTPAPTEPEDEPWYGPIFKWIYEKTGWNGDLPNFGDWFNLNRDGKYYIYYPIFLDLY